MKNNELFQNGINNIKIHWKIYRYLTGNITWKSRTFVAICRKPGKNDALLGGYPENSCGCIFSATRRRKLISVNVSLFEFSNYIYILDLPFSKYIYLFVVENLTPNRYSYPLTKEHWKHKKNCWQVIAWTNCRCQ